MNRVTTYDMKTGEPHADEAMEWKALWLAEVMRGDRGFEETYTARELDRARERMAGWSKQKTRWEM